MATRFELVLGPGDPVRLRAAGEAALAEIEEQDRRLSLFRRDSLLAHVNREAARAPVALDRDTYELLETCLEVWRASRGAFDVAVAPAMVRQGFHGPDDGVDPSSADSTSAALELDPARATIRFARAGVALDLGAIAKGHALDLAARTLREHGFASAFLHGGTSSALALGRRHDGEPWRVALEGGAGAPQALLVDRALSVSAQKGRRRADGRGHVLDPRTGEPVESEAIAAALAPSARVAEAWSTALLVLGELPPGVAGVGALLGDGPPGRRRWRGFGADPANSWTAGATLGAARATR